jgi:hypothetical protein
MCGSYRRHMPSFASKARSHNVGGSFAADIYLQFASNARSHSVGGSLAADRCQLVVVAHQRTQPVIRQHGFEGFVAAIAFDFHFELGSRLYVTEGPYHVCR